VWAPELKRKIDTIFTKVFLLKVSKGSATAVVVGGAAAAAACI
jgi:hypothetical protein